MNNLKLISAGAGSGKTYRLTNELTDLLKSGEATAAGIIATTFTKRAAAELRERVRVKLLREGLSTQANELKNALIGTVHGLGVKLLKRFAFEAGVSPQVDIIADQDHQRLFNLSMAAVLDVDEIDRVEALCERLMLSRDGIAYNWRKDILRMVEIIRGNNFSAADIARSKLKSWESLAALLPDPLEGMTMDRVTEQLKLSLNETIAALENNEADGTKKTQTAVNYLKRLRTSLRRGEQIPWGEFVKLARFETKEVGAKSRDHVSLVVGVGEAHPQYPAFQQDLKAYQDFVFDTAARAIEEYDGYKKARGRIDYTDMEVLVLGLLDNPAVQETLKRELDLLMVDEFQDTSPIQLALFLKLSQLAKRSIWVGDPKQSIYGFRGAEPRLMRAVIQANGPMDPANIQKHSWRSREDVVHACNALFTKAFHETPEAAVVLEPVRTRRNSPFGKPEESAELAERSGVIHWHFELDGGRYAHGWYQEMTAKAIAELLANPPLILPKDGDEERRMRPADIAVLCTTNRNCTGFADALAKQGIPAAIAQTGLLATAEATLLLACLKYLLNSSDSLSVAEVLLFGSRLSLPEIIEDRLDFLEAAAREENGPAGRWADNNPMLATLNDLRDSTGEYSTNELINIILERLDLRRIIVAWGEGEQRLSNIDEMRRLAVEYEDNCHRQHRAASLPGYLLYLNLLSRDGADKQGAGERPEAVNVLTYHRSKGLEWPAVVAMDLDRDQRARVWGLAVIPENEEVNLDDPLAGRWVKYWVNPYGKLTSGVDWLDALEESDWKRDAIERETAEEARLLYVGLTRARDYLILPTAKKGAPWMDRVYARGGGITPVLDPNSTDAPFDWNGHEVHKALKTWKEPRNLPGTELNYHEVPFIEGPRPGRAEYDAQSATQRWLLDRYPRASFGQPLQYFDPGVLDPDLNPKLYSQAIGHFLQGDVPPLVSAVRTERAEGLLVNYLTTHDVDASTLIARSDAFQTWLSEKGARLRVPGKGLNSQLRNRQLQATVGDRQVVKTADWLLPTDAGLVVIRDAHQTVKQLEVQQAQFSAELALLRELVLSHHPGAEVEAYLHLPISARLLPLV